MPSNEQRRQAAKRKLERQLANRAARTKRRRTITIISSVLAVVIVVGGVYLLVTMGHSNSTASAASPSSTTSAAPTTTSNPGVPTTGPCKYTTTPGTPAPAGKTVGVPADPNPTPKTGTVSITLHTNFGDIPLTLDRAAAPCTVQSFLHLASGKFYDNTNCHRETAYPTLKVLQCGDPTGQGTGGPGYTIPDEKPTNLKAGPTDPSSGTASSIYPRGVIAMANTGQPNTGGSQFFLIYADSQLPPDYAVFGATSGAGLTTLDKIAANGITPGTDPSTGQSSTQDGKPKQTVTIQQAQVS
ncbi:MAG TPA: peptidylprolyl isomerase [Pseudonocardiaceae bacterium]|nr:peptidylprolyl isomerase [Pseudonocardiaceae bacterium]